ncbi:MAG: hypothetical protein BWY77_00402 [bacterium ADurb.Bin431]|nr:MAG: hypothetical protein BWY77_00402 [bacterium ADurb.Bin431]
MRLLGQHESVEHHIRGRAPGPGRQGCAPRLQQAQAVTNERGRQGGPFSTPGQETAPQVEGGSQSPQPEGIAIEGEAGMTQLEGELILKALVKRTRDLRPAEVEGGLLLEPLQIREPAGREQLLRQRQGLIEGDLAMRETRGKTALAIEALGGAFSHQPSPAVEGEDEGIEMRGADVPVAVEAERQVEPGAKGGSPD